MSKPLPDSLTLKFGGTEVDVFPFLDVGTVGTHFRFKHKPIGEPPMYVLDLAPSEARALARALYHAARNTDSFNREVDRYFAKERSKRATHS